VRTAPFSRLALTTKKLFPSGEGMGMREKSVERTFELNYGILEQLIE
jgi:hypothetical protein